VVDFSSLVTRARRPPRSFRKDKVSGPKTPDVSIATGVKVWAGLRLAYLVFFLSSAEAATAPASLAALGRYEGANVSGQVR